MSGRLSVREYARPAKIRNAVRRRYFRRRLAAVALDERLPVPWLGSDYGGWAIPAQLVEPDWVVYCLGAGIDVSFETELIRERGCEVFSFDPTDSSAEHVAGLRQPKLHFRQVAIWNHDGTLEMYASPLPESTTLSAANLDVGRATVEVPCRSLQSLMRELGHDRIDLLKYHVEGSEYEVFDPGLLTELGVKILGIRLFHTAPPHRALSLISDIVARGYAPVAHAGSAFTFLRSDLFAAPGATEPRQRSAPARSRRLHRVGASAGARREQSRQRPGRPARDRTSDSARGPSKR